MIGFNAKTEFNRLAVTRRVTPARKKFLDKAGSRVRWAAKRSIKKVGKARKEPKKFTKTGKISKAWWKWLNEVKTRPASPPGTPPYTHTGRLRKAIVYAKTPGFTNVLIGTSAQMADDFAGLHEHGGKRYGNTFSPRPFMQPALTEIQPRLAEFWRDSIRS